MKEIIIAIKFGVIGGAIISVTSAFAIYLLGAPILYFFDVIYRSESFLDFFRNWSWGDLLLIWWGTFKSYKTAVYILKVFFLFFIICTVIKFISRNNYD